MAEMKKKPIALKQGTPYMPGVEDFVFTERHTIADIVRFALSFTNNDKTEVQAILDTMDE